MNNLISIIMVNWNGEKWLAGCFESLKNQTDKNFEVIFVDNDSTDGSVAYLKARHPEVKIIAQKENVGFARANNRGINEAVGEFILLLNTDVYFDADFIARVRQSYSEHGIDVLGVTEARFNQKKATPYLVTIDPFGFPVTYTDNLEQKRPFYISGACLFFRKDLYLKTKGLDDNFFIYAEEVDWFWRLQLLGKTFFQDQTITLYHASGGSMAGTVRPLIVKWTNQNILQMLLKNYSWYNLLWVVPIFLLQNIAEMVLFVILLQPRVAFGYLESWWFNLAHLGLIFKNRQWVQKNRQISDREIMARMYHGLGKLRSFIPFVQRRFQS